MASQKGKTAGGGAQLLDGVRRWNARGNVWAALAALGVVLVLALLSKRSEASRMPATMRRRVRELLRNAEQQSTAAAHVVDPAHALVQCDRVLATLDALEAACGGDGASLNAIGGYDVVAVREKTSIVQRRALDAVTTTLRSTGGSSTLAQQPAPTSVYTHAPPV